MSKKSKRPRRSFSDEFKQDAVDLVVKQNYSFKAPADAVGVSSRSLREWHEKLSPQQFPAWSTKMRTVGGRSGCGNDRL